MPFKFWRKLQKKFKKEPISAVAMFISLILAIWGNIISKGSLTFSIPSFSLFGTESLFWTINFAIVGAWLVIIILAVQIFRILAFD